MAYYKIVWKKSAKRDLKKLDKSVVPKILTAIENLGNNPYPSGVKKLVGSLNSYRIRIGQY